jgi:hypothetical protein
MDILIIASSLASAVIVVPLAVIVIGIQRQEHAASLVARPPGACAAIARKVLALRAASPPGTQPTSPAPDKTPREAATSRTGRNPARPPTALATGARP